MCDGIKDIDKWDDPDLLQRSKTRIASRVCNMSVLDKKELAAGYKGCLRYQIIPFLKTKEREATITTTKASLVKRDQQ